MMRRLFRDFFPEHIGVYISERSSDFVLKSGQEGFDEMQKAELAALRLPCRDIISARQIHEDSILLVDEHYLKNHPELEVADGLVSASRNLGLAVRVADCLPVYLYDERSEAIGIVHAGWRGSRNEITLKAVQLMQKHFQTSIASLRVGFGPSIRFCCYEVGEEFQAYFPQEVAVRNNRLTLDLGAVNKRQLLALGLSLSQMTDCGVCTACDQDFHSHRRDREEAGRMLALMVKQ